MRYLFVLSFLVLAPPVFAQEEDRGRDLMAEALRLFMQGFMAEMEPALEDLQGFVDNLNAYHPPEVLPNGDIIIRRKTPEEMGEPDGEVEL
ncbi:MAG: hypothetical protein AAGA06_07710 [Pseudomonadota bacterium]